MESGPAAGGETFLGTRIIFTPTGAGLLRDHSYSRTNTIPATQSAKKESNSAGTFNSPLPRYDAERGSPSITLASSGTSKLLVREARNPQIPSARITAATN